MFSASVALRDVSFSFGPKLILSNVSFTLGPHTRMGVVGPNGTGKTTLLRLIAGQMHPEAGTLTSAPAEAAIGYLPQEATARTGETVEQYLKRRTGVEAAETELMDAATGLVDATGASVDRYDKALSRYETSGAADFDIHMAETLDTVGLSSAAAHQAMATLSGGQRARASLAAVLLSRFDLLLLDEPTNDLDFAGLDLLESFVNRSAQGIMIVSHDRTFLERTTNATLELDAHHHTATLYNGGWLAYQQERAVARSLAEDRHSQYESTKKGLLDRAQQQRSWADKGVANRNNNRADNDKFLKNFLNDKSEKLAGKARQSEKALERLEVVDKPFEGWELRMELPDAQRAGDLVARLDDATAEVGDFKLGPVSVDIGWGERIAVVGANGSGKTTLLRALLGRLALTSGEQRMGPSVVLGELDQMRIAVSGEDSLVNTFERLAKMLPGDARSLLAKFGLTADHVQRAGGSLSPGERTRSMLALLMATGTNLLVLDEPTNHLDVEAIEQLEQALSTYNGTLLLVSHDRRMLEGVSVTRTIRMANGQLAS